MAPDIVSKIDELVRSSIAQRICGHSNNYKSFADAVGIARKTLTDRLEKGSFTAEQAEKIAVACKFSLDWPEWAFGSADQFIERYEKEHRPLRLRPEGVANFPRSLDEDWVSVCLSAIQSGSDWSVTADIVCNPFETEGVVVEIKAANIRIDLGKARTVRLVEGGGSIAPITIGEAILTRRNASDSTPTWRVETMAPVIGALSLPEDLCPLLNLYAGCVITISLILFAKDVEPRLKASPSEESDGPTAAELRRLSQAKLRILKRLEIAEHLTGTAASIEISSDARIFHEA